MITCDRDSICAWLSRAPSVAGSVSGCADQLDGEIGYLNDVAVACGGVRLRRDLPHTELTAEIKRMYVAPEAHGRDYGTEILWTLEEHARAAGATRAVLEAGIFSQNAVRLYLAAGYEMIEPYSGQYPGSRTNKGFSRLLMTRPDNVSSQDHPH